MREPFVINSSRKDPESNPSLAGLQFLLFSFLHTGKDATWSDKDESSESAKGS